MFRNIVNNDALLSDNYVTVTVSVPLCKQEVSCLGSFCLFGKFFPPVQVIIKETSQTEMMNFLIGFNLK